MARMFEALAQVEMQGAQNGPTKAITRHNSAESLSDAETSGKPGTDDEEVLVADEDGYVVGVGHSHNLYR